MEQISIYYHCFCVNDFKDRFFKTYNKITKSGLLTDCIDIKLICIGTPAKEFNNLDKVETILYNGNCRSEAVTLNYMRKYNQAAKVLYLHSKGVTRGDNKNVNAWIDYMEYFCIEKYKDRINELKTYSAVGVELQYHYEFKASQLFSGNFWWATNKHIQELTYCNEDNRHLAEMWVCSNPAGLYKDLHTSGKDLYHHEYVRESYTKELPII